MTAFSLQKDPSQQKASDDPGKRIGEDHDPEQLFGLAQHRVECKVFPRNHQQFQEQHDEIVIGDRTISDGETSWEIKQNQRKIGNQVDRYVRGDVHGHKQR